MVYVTADTLVGARIRVVGDFEACVAENVSDGTLLKHFDGNEWAVYDFAVEFDEPSGFMHDGAGMIDSPRCYFFRYDRNSCIVLGESLSESDFESILC